MPDFVDRLGAALLDASLAATAISGLVVLVMVQCRQPARRRAWARAGLLATLALLPLSALNPVPRFDLWRPLLAILPTTLDEPGPRPPPRADGKTPGPCRVDGPVACAADPTAPARQPGWPRRLGRFAVLAYGAGASLGLGWVGLGLAGSAWLVRRARSPSAGALGQLAALPSKAAPRKRPRLLVSDRVTRPVLVGLLRPTILIPADFDPPGAGDRLRLGLLHELAHAGSADHLFGPAATVAQAIWFFLPPVWWVGDRMKLDSEFLADSRAVADFGPSGRYASSLVDLASPGALATPRPLATGPATATGASALFQRILMLLKCPFPIEDRPPAWWRWATAATIAAATLAASCLTLRGIAGWSEGASPPVMEPARSFRLPQLVIAPADGDDAPYDLRLRLPDQFTLALEILADPVELPALEVLGHRLGPAAEADAGPSREAFRLWHRVEIRRVGGREEIRVDGLPVDPRGRPRKPAFWLAIRPARGRATRIRDLDLSW